MTKDTARLNNRLYHVIGFSSANAKSKGVEIVVRRNLNIKIIELIQDIQGRIVIVKMQIYNKNIALVSVYAPNIFDKKFYNTLTRMLLDLTNYSLIIGADFNAVWNHEKDRTGICESREQKSASVALRQWAFDLGVIDIWCMVNPTESDFSHLSARNKSFSRIDFIFATKKIFSKIISCSLLPMTITDHKAALCAYPLTTLHLVRPDGGLIQPY